MTFELPPYPAKGIGRAAQIRKQRERYRPAIARLKKALEDADAAFAEAFSTEDGRVSTQQRIRSVAFPPRQKRLG